MKKGGIDIKVERLFLLIGAKGVMGREMTFGDITDVPAIDHVFSCFLSFLCSLQLQLHRPSRLLMFVVVVIFSNLHALFSPHKARNQARESLHVSSKLYYSRLLVLACLLHLSPPSFVARRLVALLLIPFLLLFFYPLSFRTSQNYPHTCSTQGPPSQLPKMKAE